MSSSFPDTDAIYKALAHPVRRDILRWLKSPETYFPGQTSFSQHGIAAGVIEARSSLSQSTVSLHLSKLEEAGLLVSTRLGRNICYKRCEPAISTFVDRIVRSI